MLPKDIPKHQLLPEEFFLLERIETMDVFAFQDLHRHDFYEVLWFTNANKGENHQIDFEIYEVNPNQVYILSPNQIHTMEIHSKKGYLMAFPKALFDEMKLPISFLVKPYFFAHQFDSENAKTLNLLIDLMELEYRNQKRKSLLEAYCKAFFIHLSTAENNSLSANYSDRIIKLLQLIEENYIEKKEVDYYAQLLNLSKRRLNEICVQHTGETLKQLIIDRTITEAKRQLIGLKELSIKEITYKIGYQDPAYFSRIFKKKTALTPEEFRQREQSFN